MRAPTGVDERHVKSDYSRSLYTLPWAIAVLCLFTSGVTATVAGRQPRTQLPGISTPPAQSASSSLEEATQLQADADQLIEKRQFESATEKTARALAIRRLVLGGTHPDVAYS